MGFASSRFTLNPICVQGGTSTQACDPNGTRAAPDTLCAAGQYCDPFVDGGRCEVVCDPLAVAGNCSSPEICVAPPFLRGLMGVCSACIDIQGACSRDADCCGGYCDLDYGVCL